MEFLYTTDLHGDSQKYKKLLSFAVDNDISLIHLGADLLPKGSDMAIRQELFVGEELKQFYSACRSRNIKVLAFFGNDDIYLFKKQFRKFGTLLDETPYTAENYKFKAYGYVPDYPFRLKTACKLDSPDWSLKEEYYGNPLDVKRPSPSSGEPGSVFFPIRNITEYFRKKGSIQKDLDRISVTGRTIMSIHSPPCSLGLDMCSDRRAVGSAAVLNWIEKSQPLLVLSGHIHESPRVTGLWKVMVGKTTVIQPGQNYSDLTLVRVSLTGTEVQAERINLEVN
jgi:Icc-related predicted phosphoesterase